MSNVTPLFLITNAGLAAASVATPTGPYIHIVGFKIGSAYGYTPTTNQTSLQGSVLYSAAPTTYQFIGNNTLDIINQIPPEAGPWQFGEVGLYLADSSGGFSDSSVLFAIAVFETPQTKFSSLGTNVVSSYTLNCLLKLQQSTAVFQINTTTGTPSVVDIYQWSDVYPPNLSANPDVPIYNVRELDQYGDSTILSNASDSYWTVGTTYQLVRNVAVVANSSTTWVEFASNIFHTNDLGAVNRQWLLETHDGFFRSVSSIVQSGSNYRCNLNCSNDGTYNNSPLPTVPTVGSHCRLYSSTQNGNIVHYDQIVDIPPINTRTADFSTSGTLTVPLGVTVMSLSGCAGGGGGGSGGPGSISGTPSWAGGGGGGGAGQYIIKAFFPVTPGGIININIGAGGTGGPASGSIPGNNGASGGNTVISGAGFNNGVPLTLLGGSGGGGGAPGYSGFGTPAGGSGGPGFPNGSHGEDGSDGTSSGGGGPGASSPYGGGGGAGRGATSGGIPGSNAVFYGGGGGGGGGIYVAGTGNGGSGGNGAQGVMYFEW